MNDEIKEINIKIPGQILDYVDTKEHLLELFNYITNLQQELERYKHYSKTTGIEELMTENERLKELCYKQKEEYEKLFNHLIIDKPRKRNKKAIEYINTNKEKQYGLTDKNIEELLNILQNGSEENE